MIKAVIFDMDGLLINSEPFWEKAEIETFASVGITLTPAMTKQTMGMRVDEVVEYWHRRFPWQTPTQEVIVSELIQCVIALVNAHGAAMPGVYDVLKLCAERGIPMAIASSSLMSVIEAVVEKLGIADFFEVIHSAEYELYGKPHPGVFMTAAQKLGVPPDECVVFEDSINGVIAAKAGRMHCIAVPDESVRGNPRFAIADAALVSLSDFNEVYFSELDSK